MVRNDKNSCLAIGKFQQFTNLGVDKPVIIKDCVLESIAGLILVMGFIHIRPECMMDTVHSYFDHHEIVPIPYFASLKRLRVIS